MPARVDRIRSSPRRRVVFAFVLGLACLGWAGPAAATGYTWIGTSGSAGTATNWSPVGVPQPTDYAIFSSASAGTVSWPVSVNSLDRMYVSAGAPTFQIASRLGLATVFTLGPGNLTIASGHMTSPRWLCNSGASTNSNLIVDGPGTEADATQALGTSTFDGSSVFVCKLSATNGGAFRSSGALLFGSSSFGYAEIHGSSGAYASTLATTTAGSSGQGSMTFGDNGASEVRFYDGAQLSCASDFFLGRHGAGSGILRFLSAGSSATSGVIGGQAYFGANDVAGSPGGSGYVQILDGHLTIAGTCWLGDPDDPPNTTNGAKTQLQVYGGQIVFENGLIATPSLTAAALLDGGNLHVIGGSLSLHQVMPFYVGKPGGVDPELWLENHAINDVFTADPVLDALELGRSTQAALHVSGTGTVLNLHGKAVMFDQTGGYGSMTVDSAAVVNLADSLIVGGDGGGTIEVKSSGAQLNVNGPVMVNNQSQGYVVVKCDSLATTSLSGGLTMTGPGPSLMLVYGGSSANIHGITLGGNDEIALGLRSSTHVSVTDHFDMSGAAYVLVDTAGVLTYDGGTRALKVGSSSLGEASQAFVGVYQGGRAQAAPEIDVRGTLYLGVGNVVPSSPALERVRRSTAPRAGLSLLDYGPLGVVRCPLTRVIAAGVLRGFGTLSGRLHIESRNASLIVPPYYYVTSGPAARTVVGDSTATDGFVSVGQTTVGSDTLLILDQDGGDLGRISLDDGVLQLPKTGHLNNGDRLSGTGRIEGSLDVRDSARVVFLGTIKGNVQLAGELGGDVQPGLLSILGSLTLAPTARITVRVGATRQDLIAVGGAATLAGALDVRGLSGDLPIPGDTLTLLTAGTVTGTFASVTFNGGPASGVIQVLYGPGSVRVAIVGALTAVGDDAARSGALRFEAIGGPRDATLRLDLPAAAAVEVVLFDVGGRRVAELENTVLAAGRHEYPLGRGAAVSGVYFARAVIRSGAKPLVLHARAVVLR